MLCWNMGVSQSSTNNAPDHSKLLLMGFAFHIVCFFFYTLKTKIHEKEAEKIRRQQQLQRAFIVDTI